MDHSYRQSTHFRFTCVRRCESVPAVNGIAVMAAHFGHALGKRTT